ncbi:ABC transporter ATP-binding protein [Pokkaliibacter sp. CJK22405]|uniref:ABC transporter ATP-binding protein n=1 Tax=Pokkaliibacter sp. CJK22405 TaxID=3384615 RepID=UPI003984BC84
MAKSSSSSARNAFRLLLSYVYKDRPLLMFAIGMLIIATAADVTGPLLAKVFIDNYLTENSFPFWPVAGLTLAYVFTQGLAAVVRYRQTLTFSTLALNAVRDIRERVFARVIRLPLSYFDHAVTGQLVSRITNDTEAIKDLYVQFLSTVLGNTIMLIGILIAMALLDVQLMLIAVALIPLILGIIYLYQRFSGVAVEQSRQLRSDINANLGESIQGMGIIQATNQQRRFRQRFDTTNTDLYSAKLRTIRIGAILLRPAIDFLSVMVLAGVIGVFGWESLNGVVEIGVLYAFVNYLSRFTEPLMEITQRFNLYQQAMVAGERIQRLLDQEEGQFGTVTTPISAGSLSLRDVSFSYDGEHPVLKQLNLEVPPGEWLAIVGHTGSGKSSLLSLLLGFYPVTEGALRIDDVTLRDYAHDTLREGIGLIPQEPFVLAASVRDNIDMNRGLEQADIEKAARAAHLHETIERMPEGYDTLLGERGTRLSTGQRQQLAIARALAAQPRILLLDEATANIDSETEQIVQQALRALHGKVTLIVVAHRLSTIKEADRILVLSQGEIVEEGNHQALMALDDGRYQRMYRLQQQGRQLAEMVEA